QPASRKIEECAGCRSDRSLDETDGEQVVTDEGVDGAQKIRVERRLVEDVPTDPLASGNASCPLVVSVRVAQEDCEERRLTDLPDVNDAKNERQREDGGGSEPLGALGKHPQL